jgi:hypothetical protein
MELHALAEELRDRLVARQGLSRRAIRPARVPDEEILASYVTCSDCGRREVEEPELSRLIAASVSAEDFFDHLEARQKLLH